MAGTSDLLMQGSGVLSICLIGEVGTEGPVGHDRGATTLSLSVPWTRPGRIDYCAVVGPWSHRAGPTTWGNESPSARIKPRSSSASRAWGAGGWARRRRICGRGATSSPRVSAVGLGEALDVERVAQAWGSNRGGAAGSAERSRTVPLESLLSRADPARRTVEGLDGNRICVQSPSHPL